MARERWFIDGWELTDGHFRDVSARDGLYHAPSARGDDTFVAGRHGSLASAERLYAPGDFTMECWLAADATRQDLEAAYDLLLRAIAPVHRLPTFTRYLASGQQRTCQGRLAQPLTPKSVGQLAMSIEAQVVIPGVFWKDVASSTDMTAAGAALPQVLLLASKALVTAPMADLVFTITGPITNPTVTCTSDPAITDSFTYTGRVPAGATLIVDSGAWTVAGTGGFVPVLGSLSWTGDRILTVPPPAVTSGGPVVQLSGQAGGAATQLAVAGPGVYLL